MNAKVIEICKLSETVSSAALERDRQLNQARKMSTKFYDLCSEVNCNMKELKENLYSQEPPGIDAPTIKEQQKELMVSKLSFIWHKARSVWHQGRIQFTNSGLLAKAPRKT